MRKLILLIPFMFSLTEIIPQVNSAEEIIKKAQAKFNSMENFKADFYQEIISSSNANYELKGRFAYKKNAGYRIEVQDKILIGNEKEIYNIDLKQKRVVISTIDDSNTSFSIEQIINKYPSRCSLKKINEANQNAVEMIPNSSSIPFKKVRIFFNDELIINKIFIYDFANNQTVIELKNIVQNSNIPSTYFNYNPKSDFEIIDLR